MVVHGQSFNFNIASPCAEHSQSDSAISATLLLLYAYKFLLYSHKLGAKGDRLCLLIRMDSWGGFLVDKFC